MKLNTKTNIWIIGLIMLVVATLLFIVVKVTLLFVASYLFAIAGIAIMCLSNVYLTNNKKNYPWFAALPLTAWRYLSTEVIFSAIFIVRENVFTVSFPIGWYVIIHTAILAFFTVQLILLNGGNEYIEKRGDVVREKVLDLRLVVVDLEAAAEKMPAMKNELKAAADAVRYSDPMSHPSLAGYEASIKNSVELIEQAVAQGANETVSNLCATLHRQIKDRNRQVKLMK